MALFILLAGAQLESGVALPPGRTRNLDLVRNLKKGSLLIVSVPVQPSSTGTTTAAEGAGAGAGGVKNLKAGGGPGVWREGKVVKRSAKAKTYDVKFLGNCNGGVHAGAVEKGVPLYRVEPVVAWRAAFSAADKRAHKKRTGAVSAAEFGRVINGLDADESEEPVLGEQAVLALAALYPHAESSSSGGGGVGEESGSFQVDYSAFIDEVLAHPAQSGAGAGAGAEGGSAELGIALPMVNLYGVVLVRTDLRAMLRAHVSRSSAESAGAGDQEAAGKFRNTVSSTFIRYLFFILHLHFALHVTFAKWPASSATPSPPATRCAKPSAGSTRTTAV